MSLFRKNTDSVKASEIRANRDGKSFSCDALPINPPYEYTVFDVMVETMLE